jgi:hypothetical protein
VLDHREFMGRRLEASLNQGFIPQTVDTRGLKLYEARVLGRSRATPKSKVAGTC